MILESKFTHIFSSIVSNSMFIEGRKNRALFPAHFVNRGRRIFLEPLFSDVDKSVRKAPKFIKNRTENTFWQFFRRCETRLSGKDPSLIQYPSNCMLFACVAGSGRICLVYNPKKWFQLSWLDLLGNQSQNLDTRFVRKTNFPKRWRPGWCTQWPRAIYFLKSCRFRWYIFDFGVTVRATKFSSELDERFCSWWKTLGTNFSVKVETTKVTTQVCTSL